MVPSLSQLGTCINLGLVGNRMGVLGAALGCISSIRTYSQQAIAKVMEFCVQRFV